MQPNFEFAYKTAEILLRHLVLPSATLNAVQNRLPNGSHKYPTNQVQPYVPVQAVLPGNGIP